MNIRSRVFLLSAGMLSAMLVLAAACGGGTSSTDKTATAGAGGGAKGSPTAAASGGAPADMAADAQQTLTVNDALTTGAEPNTVDPQGVAYTYEWSVEKSLYLNLLDLDPKTSELIPEAAVEVPTVANGDISADGMTVTVKLKPGLKWSDGSPITAQDFVYGIIRGFDLNVSGAGYGGFVTQIQGTDAATKLDPKSATYSADVATAFKDSVVAVDATTLKILLTGPSASFLSNLYLPITAAVQKANVDTLGTNFGLAAGAAQMVTSGPFTVKEWVAKDHITLARNDNYTVGHKAYLKELTFKFIEDQNQAYNAFQAGQLDETSIPPALFPTVSTDSSTKDQVRVEDVFGTDWVSVDKTLDPWKNKDFVIAVNQATDRDTIAKDVYFNTRKGYYAPCAIGVVACSEDLFSNLAFDLTKAKASMAKAYPNGNIPNVTIEVQDDPTAKALATTLQSQWKEVGVTVDIVTTDQKTLRADMKGHKSGTQITGWTMDYADPTDLWSIFTTAQVGGNNLGFYSNPDFDKAAADQDTILDPAARATALKNVASIIANDPTGIYFTVRERVQIIKPYVKGMTASPFNYAVYGDQHWSEVYIAKH